MRRASSSLSMALILLLCLFLALFSVCSGISRASGQSPLQTYIVHVNHPEGRVFSQEEDLQTWYQSFLPSSTTESKSDSTPQERMLYSYQHVISGFAARLTPEEVSAMQRKEGFVWARPQKVHKLLTTHSPTFLGLQQQVGLWRSSNGGKGMIVGVLDTGVLPNHPSFRGDGMPPPPAKWKGRCEFGASECNNKLIGARSFNIAAMALNGKEVAAESPIDEDGHGTHTASTAAGGSVMQAEALGNAKGTAVGMAPGAHLAIYKVCFGEDCADADILAGLDAAVEDGVDVLSLSLGGESAPFFNDTIAVGSFAAIQKGIVVSCAAGNSGPFGATLSNEAPWILTVGASSQDRDIVATAKLGNGMEFDGESLFQSNFPPQLLPLVYAGMNGKQESALCAAGSLKGMDVKGKVVFCDRGGGIARIAKGQEVKDAGGAAMILANQETDGFSTLADAHALPATHVSFLAGQKIKAYINSTMTPTATILFKGTVIGNPSAPAVTSFSSRGPNMVSPGILKPDIIGPGVSILAAWPFQLDNNTASKSTFNIISGTSMSCPHLSGIAALIKSAHPDWSPAAIKSAIMTTADQLNIAGKPIVDERNLPYLCSLGYSDEAVGVIAHKSVKCSQLSRIPEGQLNYPSFALNLGSPQTFTRTVTNVGEAYSTYVVSVVPPPGTYVTVKPSKLYFSKLNQKTTYSVTFTRSSSADRSGEYTQGNLKWVFGNYSVRSPISVMFK